MRILVTRLLIAQVNDSKVEDLKIKQLLNKENEADSVYDHSFTPIRIDLDKISGYKPTQGSQKAHGRQTTDIILDGVFITIDVTPESFFKLWTAGMNVMNVNTDLDEIK